MLLGIDILSTVVIKSWLNYLIPMLGMSFMTLVVDDIYLSMSLLLMLHVEPVLWSMGE